MYLTKPPTWHANLHTHAGPWAKSWKPVSLFSLCLLLTFYQLKTQHPAKFKALSCLPHKVSLCICMPTVPPEPCPTTLQLQWPTPQRVLLFVPIGFCLEVFHQLQPHGFVWPSAKLRNGFSCTSVSRSKENLIKAVWCSTNELILHLKKKTRWKNIPSDQESCREAYEKALSEPRNFTLTVHPT